MAELENTARRAREAGNVLAASSTAARNAALEAVEKELKMSQAAIERANRADKEAALKDGLSGPLQARLNVEGEKFQTLLSGLQDVRKVDDPVGKVSLARELDTGLNLYRVSCPIGVLCIIFESRPEAAVQIASLAIKSGNAVILKGGREALQSNTALVKAFRNGLKAAGLPEDCVQLVSTRQDVQALLALDQYIDLVIPRGSNQLVRSVMDSTKIPVMGHADGICSVFLDKEADLSKAVRVIVDAKTQYTAACNTAECLLVHKDVVETMLPVVGKALADAKVKLHADETCLPFLPKDSVVPATEEDFRTEYLGLEMAVRVVDDVDAAILHANTNGSHHTDMIVTENAETAERYLQGVSSAGVFHNASTRFADGFRYGFGAEVGVSTNKIHARGPVGLEGLLIYKYRLLGNGHIAGDYGSGPGKRAFTHRPLPVPSDGLAPRVGDSPTVKLALVGVGAFLAGAAAAFALAPAQSKQPQQAL